MSENENANWDDTVDIESKQGTKFGPCDYSGGLMCRLHLAVSIDEL